MSTSITKPRVSLGFSRLSNSALASVAKNIVTQMTNNVNFHTPSPDLAAITSAADALETAVEAAYSRDRVAIAERNADRAALVSLLRREAAYVQGHCQDDVAILISSGFNATKQPQPAGNLPPPQNVRLSYTGNSGEFFLRFNKVRNASGYTVQQATNSNGPWTTRDPITSSRRTRLTGFTPGTVYFVRVAANGAAGLSPYGGPATAMAV